MGSHSAGRHARHSAAAQSTSAIVVERITADVSAPPSTPRGPAPAASRGDPGSVPWSAVVGDAVGIARPPAAAPRRAASDAWASSARVGHAADDTGADFSPSRTAYVTRPAERGVSGWEAPAGWSTPTGWQSTTAPDAPTRRATPPYQGAAHPARGADPLGLVTPPGSTVPVSSSAPIGTTAPRGFTAPDGFAAALDAAAPLGAPVPRDTTTPLGALSALGTSSPPATDPLGTSSPLAGPLGMAGPVRSTSPLDTVTARGAGAPRGTGTQPMAAVGRGTTSARDAARIASFGQAAVVTPGIPNSLPPGERDTLTGPMSASTTARRARSAGGAPSAAAPRPTTARAPIAPASTSPLSSSPLSSSPLSSSPLAAGTGPGSRRGEAGWGEAGWGDDGWDGSSSGDRRRARGAGDRTRRKVGGPGPATRPRNAADGDSALTSTARLASPGSRTDRFADASFTASHSPAASRTAAASRTSAARRASEAHQAPDDAGRISGAHRAPMRRGNGRARLAAAGTVSLAGLSAIVAGVALGGDPGSTTQPLATAAGETPTIQYRGSTSVLTFGASGSQASRGHTRTTPPRAQLAPSADQPELDTTTVSPTTGPIPVITLVPRDEQAATGPTDLRGLIPSTGAGTTASASPTSSASPTASRSQTSGDGSLPFDPASPATSQPATPSPSASSSSGTLPFHPSPVEVTPLSSSWFHSSTSHSTASPSASSTTGH
ncbi:hypothetical protein [Frankia canadensis]|uniref:hypothetical protein n=1 Tax=Frankia canadensis TaxID=1836972 RepID=UPI000C7C2726|nr:hypothetical protein [Frankia canadensis]